MEGLVKSNQWNSNGSLYDDAVDQYIQSVLHQKPQSSGSSEHRSRVLGFLQGGIADLNAVTSLGSPSKDVSMLSTSLGALPSVHFQDEGGDGPPSILGNHFNAAVLGCSENEQSEQGNAAALPQKLRGYGLVQRHEPLEHSSPSRQKAVAKTRAAAGEPQYAVGAFTRTHTRLPDQGRDESAMTSSTKNKVLRTLRPRSTPAEIQQSLPPARAVTTSLDWLSATKLDPATYPTYSTYGITRSQLDKKLHDTRRSMWLAFAARTDLPDRAPAVSSEGRLIGLAPAPPLQLI